MADSITEPEDKGRVFPEFCDLNTWTDIEAFIVEEELTKNYLSGRLTEKLWTDAILRLWQAASEDIAPDVPVSVPSRDEIKAIVTSHATLVERIRSAATENVTGELSNKLSEDDVRSILHSAIVESGPSERSLLGVSDFVALRDNCSTISEEILIKIFLSRGESGAMRRAALIALSGLPTDRFIDMLTTFESRLRSGALELVWFLEVLEIHSSFTPAIISSYADQRLIRVLGELLKSGDLRLCDVDVVFSIMSGAAWDKARLRLVRDGFGEIYW